MIFFLCVRQCLSARRAAARRDLPYQPASCRDRFKARSLVEPGCSALTEPPSASGPFSTDPRDRDHGPSRGLP
jgi:hypothetical protein